MVEETLKRAIKGWVKNPVLSVPFIIVAAIAFTLLFLFLVKSGISPENIEAALSGRFLIQFVMFFLLLVVIYAFIFAGALGMCLEVYEKGKTSFSTLFTGGKKYFGKVFVTTLILLLIILTIFAVISVLLIQISKPIIKNELEGYK